MKLAVIYHSETENTKQAAEWIADGMNEVSGVEARAFSIEKVDEDFVKEAKGIVVGSPSYMAQMTPQIHNWLFEKAGENGWRICNRAVHTWWRNSGHSVYFDN